MSADVKLSPKANAISDRIQRLAFKHGQAGVGHFFAGIGETGQEERIHTHRFASRNDPGQPKGWNKLAPFCPTLAGNITHFAHLLRGEAVNGWYQGLVFEDAAEAAAFVAAIPEAVA